MPTAAPDRDDDRADDARLAAQPADGGTHDAFALWLDLGGSD